MFQAVLLLLGRILIAAEFLWAAFEEIMHMQETVANMESNQIPFIYFFLGGVFFLQIVGSLMLLFGYKGRLGALLLIIILIPSSFFLQNLTLQSGERILEQMMFMKDKAILGGLLAFAAVGPGKLAFDR